MVHTLPLAEIWWQGLTYDQKQFCIAYWNKHCTSNKTSVPAFCYSCSLAGVDFHNMEGWPEWKPSQFNGDRI